MRGLDIVATDAAFWSKSGETRFTGIVRSADVRGALAAWGFAPSVEAERFEATGELRWPGSPFDFALAHVSGSASLALDTGRFLTVEPGGARIMSLINFSEILRRMRLDFSDVFGRGADFDEVRADLVADNGLAHFARPAEITGSAASFRIGGTVNLDTGALDNEMIVTLSVLHRNLPWYAAFLAFSNPASAAGVLLGSQVLFRNQIKQFSSGKYTIGGTYEDPQVTFVGIWRDDLATPDLPAATTSPPKAVARREESEDEDGLEEGRGRGFRLDCRQPCETRRRDLSANDPVAKARTALWDARDVSERDVNGLLGRLATRAIDVGELYFQLAGHESWSLEDGAVKSGAFAVDRGVGVRAISGDKTGFAYVDDGRLAGARRRCRRGPRHRAQRPRRTGRVDEGRSAGPLSGRRSHPSRRRRRQGRAAAAHRRLRPCAGYARAGGDGAHLPRPRDESGGGHGRHVQRRCAAAHALRRFRHRRTGRPPRTGLQRRRRSLRSGLAACRRPSGSRRPPRPVRRRSRPGSRARRVGEPGGRGRSGRPHAGGARPRLARRAVARSCGPRLGGGFQPQGARPRSPGASARKWRPTCVRWWTTRRSPGGAAR